MAFSEDLVFHTLELPKYDGRSDNLEGLPRLEKWLYFLKHAEHWEAEELATRLVEAEFREAAGVLEMISQSPEERQFYEARLKFLHDAEARLIAAREEGRVEGRSVEGSMAGKIQLLQQLLGEEEASLQELLQRSHADLAHLLSTLQERLRSRRA